MREKYEDDFEAGMGAEAVKKLLQEIDLEQLSARAARGAGERLAARRRPGSSSAWRWWTPSACPATSRSG